MARLQVPQLMDYSATIQANNSMSNAFNQLSNQSQDHLNYLETQKQNAFNNKYKTDTFNETKRMNNLNFTKYNDSLKEKQDIKDANAASFKMLYPEKYSSFSAQFGDVPTAENANRMNKLMGNIDLSNINQRETFNYNKDADERNYNYKVGQDKIRNGQWQQDFNFRQGQANKPKYTQVTTTDAQGNPVLSFVDPYTGKILKTGMKVYQTPKQLSPEQADYYNARNQEIKDKRIAEIEKNFRASNEFSKLGEADQMKAIDYLKANGKAPQISYDNSWFGKGYYMPQSAAEKVTKQKQLEEDMKLLGL